MAKITVEITAVRKITYNQIVEVEAEDYEFIKDLSDDDVSEWVRTIGKSLSINPEYRVLQKYIDTSDVFDGGDEFTNVSVQPVPDK